MVGDSLSAEYGLPRGTGWVALLEQKLAAEKQGRADFSFFWCGENASACRSAPAAHITQALAEGFAAAR